MKCPLCGSNHFYVKDPEDHFSSYSFQVNNETLEFEDDLEPGKIPKIENTTETFCNQCAWHGKWNQLK